MTRNPGFGRAKLRLSQGMTRNPGSDRTSPYQTGTAQASCLFFSAGAGVFPISANLIKASAGRMYFVPEGQDDSSQARSAWSPEENSPVPAGRLNGSRLRLNAFDRPSR